MRKKPHELLEELRTAENLVESTQSEFLRAMGWEHTCDTHALWLWRKVIDGKELRVSESAAMHIAENECPWPYEGEECHPEGYQGSCACNTCLSYGE